MRKQKKCPTAQFMFVYCRHFTVYATILKGTVQRDFRPPVFFTNQLKYFRFWFRFRQDICIFPNHHAVSYCAESVFSTLKYKIFKEVNILRGKQNANFGSPCFLAIYPGIALAKYSVCNAYSSTCSKGKIPNLWCVMHYI